MGNKGPDRLYCEKKDKEKYDLLKKESVFKGLDLIHIFMLSLSIGYKERRRVQLKSKEGLILLYHVPEEYKSIMKAVAIEEKKGDLKIISNPAELYSIAEEYAAGGIGILYQKINENFGRYEKHLEAEILELIEKIKQGSQ